MTGITVCREGHHAAYSQARMGPVENPLTSTLIIMIKGKLKKSVDAYRFGPIVF